MSTTDSDPLAWARDYTPVLQSLGDENGAERPSVCYDAIDIDFPLVEPAVDSDEATA